SVYRRWSWTAHARRVLCRRDRASPSGAALTPELVGVHAELGELLLELLAIHADLLGGFRDVALMPRERGAEEVTLEAIDDRLLRVLARGRLSAHRGRQIVELDRRPRRERHRLLDRVLELPHVARPRVGEERAIGTRHKRPALAAQSLRRCREEVLDEQRHV